MVRCKHWAWMALGGLLLLSAAGMGLWSLRTARFEGAVNAAGVDLTQPDVYIYTPSLSRLPRDVIQAPVIRDLLTEDFAFYYEEHEDRLGLRGVLKRMAFEHRTTLTDRLIESALDEPAEVAAWADAKGAPRYWLIAMSRGLMARALQELAPLATQDRQFSTLGVLQIHGVSVPVYALTLSPRRTLAVLSSGDRVLVLSDPGLLFGASRQLDDTSRGVIADLLSGEAGPQSVYRRGFGLGEPGVGHTVVADARLLSFGYQHFFSGLRAVRFELGAQGRALTTWLRVQPAAPPPVPAERTLWQGLPFNPAACARLPADWARAQAVLAPASGASQVLPTSMAWTALAGELDGPAAVCWYARSQLHTPLWVAQTRSDGPAPAAALEAVSRWLRPAGSAEMPAAPTRTGSLQWPYQVAAPWAALRRTEPAGYRPTLARQGRWITFSPDEALVSQALDAQARRYPSVATSWPDGAAPPLAVLVPSQLADLVRHEALAVLEPGQTPFRQAAEQRLMPRLDALRKLPAVQAVASGVADAQGWVHVQWQPLPGAAASKGSSKK